MDWRKITINISFIWITSKTASTKGDTGKLIRAEINGIPCTYIKENGELKLLGCESFESIQKEKIQKNLIEKKTSLETEKLNNLNNKEEINKKIQNIVNQSKQIEDENKIENMDPRERIKILREQYQKNN